MTRRCNRLVSIWSVLGCALASSLACGGAAAPELATGGHDAPPLEVEGAATDAVSDVLTAGAPVVVFLGDSLSAGYELPADEAFPAVLGRRLASAGRAVRIVNAGVSGDTTAGGLARVDWVLRQNPDVFVLELGANDGLRGLDLAETEANLRAIAERARAAGARVLLCGMRLPPNYGAEYVEAFEAVFPRVAADLGLDLMPFLLEGVAGEPELNLADGIHPNAAGHAHLAERIHPFVEALLPAP